MNAPRARFFVTGTDTEIGKTLVSSAHAARLRAAGPARRRDEADRGRRIERDGELHNEDADQLDAAGNVQLPPAFARRIC